MALKVLVVLDGDFRFDPTGNPPQADFSFSVLISALTGAGFDVTKAHLGTDSSATAGFSPFRFDAPPAGRSLFDFDAIWLIGWSGRNADNPALGQSSVVGGLGAAQLNALAAYMDAGGGVFATGDHDSVGADMGGYIPRVRVMRTWYGFNDPATPFPQPLHPDLRNFTKLDAGRADTVHKKTSADTPPSQYPPVTSGDPDYVWFDNQSDRFPQVITPIPANPAHPILRRDGRDIVNYPDHMHEGNTLGTVSTAAYDYATVHSPFGDTSQLEFRAIAGSPELPVVIANGQGLAHASRFAAFPNSQISSVASPKTVNTLSVYDGRNVGVGRIVTGSTFHHYIDINLTGSTAVSATPLATTNAGTDAAKGHGYNDSPDVLADIKTVYANITNWIARPRPVLGLILERSTFSQDEVTATATFEHAVLVTIDGLKPSQFPGGGVTALGSPPGLATWAPTVTVAGGYPMQFVPVSIDSDDDIHNDRVQRLTVTYNLTFTGDAFSGLTMPTPVQVSATLAVAVPPASATDTGWLQLVRSANPFMLDLADGNATTWLSSDIKVFHVLEGSNFLGVPLPSGATRDDALTFLRSLTSSISDAAFTALTPTEEGSVLSAFPYAFGIPFRRVYNFALARVRVNAADADPVRVFFRIFTTQTTAALTYHINSATTLPVDGFQRTPGADPIDLPGTQNGGADWLSFPMFSAVRGGPPDAQLDDDNRKPVTTAQGFKVFGALIDNNFGDPYLPPTPGSGALPVSLPTLLTGEHQCLVAEVFYAGTPILDGATPWTSDKLSQRNLAVSFVANPGLDDSRVALHTFEVEATPTPVSAAQPPDELLIQSSSNTPEGAEVHVFLSTWSAKHVIDLATRCYPRHDIQRVDEHTISLPARGTHYVPIPQSVNRQNGILSVEFPLGIRKGQRFDVSVRQITNRWRRAKYPPPNVQRIPREELDRLLASLPTPPERGVKGAFPLGKNKVLVTDLSAFDESGDHALLIEHPDPAAVAAAVADSGRWREPIGGFQLGVPVSTREAMVPHAVRLLSLMRWRAAQPTLSPRWRLTMTRYVAQLSDKVQALGVNPWLVPATPDGMVPPDAGTPAVPPGSDVDQLIQALTRLLRRPGCALIVIALLVLAFSVLWLIIH